MRFAPFVISVPFLIGALQVISPIGAAQAAALDAQQATELLSKTNAINSKCSFLDAAKSQDLKDFVARAELSLATKQSVSAARKFIAAGKTAGKAAVCDENARKLVNDVLAAASIAASAAPIADATSQEQPEPAQALAAPTDPVVESQPPEPAVVAAAPKPKPKTIKLKPKKPEAKVAVAPPAPKPKAVTKGLGQYASIAERYYVALKCGNMKGAALNALYGNVLAGHKQAMSANNPRKVRAALQQAEARANGKTCA
jgi:outer membrane biosynthesis protein TonB